MRTVFLLLFVAFIGLVGHAQALSSGAAQYEKTFWASINKAKGLDYQVSQGAYENAVTQATNNLKQLKKAAPDYNVEKHEAELQKVTAVIQTAKSELALSQDLKVLDSKMELVRKGYKEDDPSLGYLVDNARYQVEILLKRSPNYDASAYKKELDTMEKEADSRQASEKQSLDDAGTFLEEYKKAFIGLSTFSHVIETGTEETEKQERPKKIASLVEKMNSFVNSDIGKKAETIDSEYFKREIKSELDNEIGRNAGELQTHKKWALEGHRKSEILGAYFKLKAIEAYWNGQSRLFPSNSAVKAELAKTQAVLAECGTLSETEARWQKNYAKNLTTVTMKPAAVQDAAIEAEMKKTYLACEYGKGANVIKVNLTTNQWTLFHDELTGAVTSRGIGFATIVYKDSNGNCWTDTFGILQAKLDNGWGPSGKYYKYDQKSQILCENVR